MKSPTTRQGLRAPARLTFLAVALALSASLLTGQGAFPQSRRVAIFGSLVASGTGDDTGKEGTRASSAGCRSPAGGRW